MRAKAIVLALSAYAAFGQDATRVFHLHHIDSTQDLNEFATLVRTLSDIPDLSTDAAQKTMSVRGTPSQIAIAEFLFTELDRQTVPDSATQEFRVSSNSDDVVRLFFAPNTATVQQFQEIATTIRTIAEIRRVFTFNSLRALGVRATADQIAVTDFLIHELDQPADAKRVNSREIQMIDTSKYPATQVRVFYLPYTATVQQFQEVATMIRTVAEIRRVFTYNSARAMILRGTSDQMALAGWFIEELGKPVTAGTASPKYTYVVEGRDYEDMVRIFYVKDTPTIAAFQQVATQVRASTGMRRVFTYNESRALAVRGTEAQLATTEQMLQDRQIASK
jgi:hypothetical protein